ncbi:MAG: NADH-quinone oxidoreductase subunit H [Lachnospiraceae bacterium]|nr:NADH-quinone oxidoreductase subunit H [Lachnospiraceae bacterium]
MLERAIWTICYILLAPLLGGFLSGLERKIGARMQGRKGPSVWQSFMDVKKLFSKKSQQVNGGQMFLVISYFFFVVVTGTLIFAGYDLLLAFFTLTTASMFLVAAGSCTHSPYSLIGANCEMIQMMAYEPMVLLTAVGFYLACGDFDVQSIATAGGWLPIVKLPGVFVGFMFILTIKLRKSPFDISTSHHAHQEIVKGITTEMSGPMLGIFEISEWYEKVFLTAIVGLFFVNGSPLSYVVAVVVMFLAFFIEILIDNSCARLSWEQMLKSSWFATIVFGGINIVVLQILK